MTHAEKLAQAAAAAQAAVKSEVDSIAELSPKQLYAIDMILLGHGDDDVADQVDVCRSTIHRWKTFHKAFVERLNLRRAEIWGAAGERLRAGLDEAVDALVMQIRDGTSTEKFRAAKALLHMANARQFFQPPAPVADEAEKQSL